jgi:hypothetical protein
LKVAPAERKGVLLAANKWAQVMEFCIRNRWIRWEPAGAPGSVQEISREEAADVHFCRLAETYFTIREAVR